MKKFFEVRFPSKLGAHFAKWTYENGCTVQLSYMLDEFFNGQCVVTYVIVPEEKENDFRTEFKNYIK